jgi:phage baseplate assembly protein W
MADLFVYQPFKLRDDRGAIAVTDDADRHLRDKILAVLFTAPGERVNAPRFGVGLDRTVFEGLDELTISAVEFRIAEGMRRELGDEAIIDGVDVDANPEHGELLISIAYRRRSDRATRNLEIVL